ncbi:hypothetical protein [Limobrevibacterium gyesilva]|uniref:Gamma-glutamyl-gamma-aminobutyrate hydrolase n=1 Tax=Limobrevibacterium gyesilva TaxID=2991712 RepID=A0AA42CG10_9PROT|nr:hypothetical protein [Limobrevibacterium gyesilva]MCW3477229.1 hypothetical protein [Limobrevibacterium gyesilva]
MNKLATPWAGLQWHPEWHYIPDEPSKSIFRAFGDACRMHTAGIRRVE